MAAWSVTAFGGKPLAQLEEEEPERFGFDKEVLAEEVRKAGWKTLNGKGATEFGIASTAARMISCIFHDEKQFSRHPPIWTENTEKQVSMPACL